MAQPLTEFRVRDIQRLAPVLAKEQGIRTVGKLLYTFPMRHLDRTRVRLVRELDGNMPFVQVAGTLGTPEWKAGKTKKKRLTATLTDAAGDTLELVWFVKAQNIERMLMPGHRYIAFGKPQLYGRTLTIAHPELTLEAAADRTSNITGMTKDGATALTPIYGTTEAMKRAGLATEGVAALMREILRQIEELPEMLPRDVLEYLPEAVSYDEAVRGMHFPADAKAFSAARRRLAFQELFLGQLQAARKRFVRGRVRQGFMFDKLGYWFNTFFTKHLPFELTEGQKQSVRDIRADVKSGHQMNRLLQGDVGSGKTVVALMAMLMAMDNGYQAAFMAPTEILAQQHLASLSELTKGLGLRVALLTGSTKTAARREILQACLDGELHILIGTHALLEDRVQFAALGMVVVDEQHRFGVAQRARLWAKAKGGVPHILVMTATPIPRTLAMTRYADLDLSVIRQMPLGRKPIQTIVRGISAWPTVAQSLRRELDAGRQAYYVCPMIDDNEAAERQSVTAGYTQLREHLPTHTYSADILHGRMAPVEKEAIMKRFVEGKLQVLVSTTVIEVGVNVPNSTIMIIENAELFGLSQLHQLRGRVGRGGEQSYCVLMHGVKLSAEAKVRLQTMARTTDGFEIAEVDMKLRGAGDIEGTRQSGDAQLLVANLAEDFELLRAAKEAANTLVARDAMLNQPDHAPLKKHYRHHLQTRRTFSEVG